MTSQHCLEEKKIPSEIHKERNAFSYDDEMGSVPNKGNSYSILCFILVCPCFNSAQVPGKEEESFYRGKG